CDAPAHPTRKSPRVHDLRSFLLPHSHRPIGLSRNEPALMARTCADAACDKDSYRVAALPLLGSAQDFATIKTCAADAACRDRPAACPLRCVVHTHCPRRKRMNGL